MKFSYWFVDRLAYSSESLDIANAGLSSSNASLLQRPVYCISMEALNFSLLENGSSFDVVAWLVTYKLPPELLSDDVMSSVAWFLSIRLLIMPLRFFIDLLLCALFR